MENNFQYVIIGAGSAGCVLANRLSENPENKVALTEGLCIVLKYPTGI